MQIELNTIFFLSKVEVKGCNAMFDGKNLFDQTLRNDLRTYDNIQKEITQLAIYYMILISKNIIRR